MKAMYQNDERDGETLVESLFDRAIGLSQIGQYAEAIANLDQLLEAEPEHYEVWNERGVILERLDRYEDAVASYDKVLAIKPDFYQAWYNRGNALFNLERYSESVASFDKALEANPNYYEAWNNRAIVQEKAGQYVEAIASYDKVLAFRSSAYEAWYNRAIVLEKLEQNEEAITNYEQAVAIRPGYYEAWYNRAIVLEKLERYAEAADSYKRAVAVQPNFANAWNNLGIVQERLGNYNEAIASYDKAIFLQPDFYQAWYNLGNSLRLLDRYNEAINCYQQAIQSKPDYAEAYCNLGVTFDAQHQLEEAIKYYQQALELQPDFPEVRKNLSLTYLKLVPRWHFVMMNDLQRGDRYDQALRKVVTPDTTVLDIGSGSGLLAMMAARAGAKQVITCELIKPIADIAQEIIQLNGLADKISVINKKSFNLSIGVDLPEPADVLVSEIFDVGLLGENAIPTIKHARTYLLKPHAKIIPKSATVYAALIESQELANEDRVELISNFDLSPFNRFSSNFTYLQKQLNHYSHRSLSAPFEVFSFDFYTDLALEAEKIIEVPVAESGTCHGFVFWFRLWLDDEIFVDTSPYEGEASTHWMQAIQILKSSVTVTKSQILQVIAKHDGANITFQLYNLRSLQEIYNF